jgi:hypothetical protein
MTYPTINRWINKPRPAEQLWISHLVEAGAFINGFLEMRMRCHTPTRLPFDLFHAIESSFKFTTINENWFRSLKHFASIPAVFQGTRGNPSASSSF